MLSADVVTLGPIKGFSTKKVSDLNIQWIQSLLGICDTRLQIPTLKKLTVY
jgi:hypothetical protein